ncbi:MAG TPA: hypothetical protein VIF62_10700, partial [Labilithrix sp.]
ALVNGKSEDWVRRRSKHKSSAIERYRRELGTFKELSLGDWTPLDRAIPEIAAAIAAAERGGSGGDGPSTSGKSEDKCADVGDAGACGHAGGLGVVGSNPSAPTGFERRPLPEPFGLSAMLASLPKAIRSGVGTARARRRGISTGGDRESSLGFRLARRGCCFVRR